MGQRKNTKQIVAITAADISAAFVGQWAEKYPPLLSTTQAASMLGVTGNSLGHLASQGRLDGTFAKVAGKRRFWRDRLISHVASGKAAPKRGPG